MSEERELTVTEHLFIDAFMLVAGCVLYGLIAQRPPTPGFVLEGAIGIAIGDAWGIFRRARARRKRR